MAEIAFLSGHGATLLADICWVSSGAVKAREEADTIDAHHSFQPSALGDPDEFGASHAVGVGGGFADDETPPRS